MNRPPKLYVSMWSLIEASQPPEDILAVCQRIHLDVMEASYCGQDLFLDYDSSKYPNTHSHKLDVHLMIESPMQWLKSCSFLSQIASVSVHLDDLQEVQLCREFSSDHEIEFGVVLRLDDDWDLLIKNIETVKQVIVMGTPIGVKGVDMDRNALRNVLALGALRERRGFNYDIVFDGGIREDTYLPIIEHGADALAIGSLLCQSQQSPSLFSASLQSN